MPFALMQSFQVGSGACPILCMLDEAICVVTAAVPYQTNSFFPCGSRITFVYQEMEGVHREGCLD